MRSYSDLRGASFKPLPIIYGRMFCAVAILAAVFYAPRADVAIFLPYFNLNVVKNSVK